MNLLFRILHAGHASGTHHKLALDALRHVGGPDAERWQRLLLKHAGLYLDGSKAPDSQFKDFKNHVLHVREGLWGGAPEKAANWYQHLLAALRDHNWSEAAWCAGVLSHYYTDPIHPFHTGQTVAENNVHRAVEWSISRSYEALSGMGERSLPKIDITLGVGNNWLEELMVAGATRANAQYEALLAHYDFRRGVVNPPDGLDATGQALVGDLIRYAQLSFAQVLQRALAESTVVPPDVGLTAEVLLATLKWPIKAVLKRLDDKALRLQVEAMYDELQSTGHVEHAMPEDERIVRNLHAKEVLARLAPPSAVKLDAGEALSSNKVRGERERRPVVVAMPPASSKSTTAVRTTPPAPPVTDIPARQSAIAPVEVQPAVLESGSIAVVAAQLSIASPKPAPDSLVREESEPLTMSAALASAAASAAAASLSGLGRLGTVRPSGTTGSEAAPATLTPAPVAAPASVVTARPGPQPHQYPQRHGQLDTPLAPTAVRTVSIVPQVVAKAATAEATAGADDARVHLIPDQDVVDAPSIGPKTADRLKAVGIKTVADLFAADPGALAEELDTAHIRAKTIAEWQDQARLVCEVPGLRGTGAQLLVGAGYRDLRRIARAEPRQVSADVLKFAQSADGQRILRSGGAPDLEKIVIWVQAAERAWAAKAA